MQRSGILLALALLTLCAACGANTKSGASSQARQPTDPRGVPTATLPAILPSAIPAVTVADGSVSEQLNVVPTSYTIRSGDTMAAIAQRLGVPLAALLSYNSDINPNALIVGQTLRVPPPASATPSATGSSTQRSGTPAAGTSGGTTRSTPVATSATTTSGAASGETYTVKSGDTACVIAGSLHVTLADLASANGLSIGQMASLRVGQQLKVPPRQSASPGC